ncbi:arylsulfatase A-like enzyme [Lewinella marina]|uniref:Heparan N-sulfatase n=1 Tax=Neolewinella marina TaxID=438751 RepID=A0A2G0CBW5_9BACT|nr:sulfatase [Neolewinella marina]NJB87047.1 arylsulfatase A-like enzyme [Neolewinella marina]PHK97417.1 heparan N-sulfatase [Neolewinella marina]
MKVATVLLGLIALGGFWHAPQKSSAPERPNILLFLADDWSYPHAGAYGDPVVQTPNFDRLAAGGMLFTNAYCASPSCSPSRASILTGRYPHQNGAMGNLWSEFSAEAVVYPRQLEEAGYLVGHDQKGWGPGDFRSTGWPHNPAGRAYEDITQLLDERQEGQPFCYWFGSQDPHRNYLTNLGAWSGMEADSVDVPPFFPDVPCVRNDLLDYYAEVERFDRHLGEVVDLLESRGELDNTLIIVTSDNGMPFPRAKANLYDAGTRMPFVAHWPDRIPAGTVRHSYVNLASLAATFLAAAGVEVPAAMTLPSILPELSDATAPGADHVFLERERHAQVRADSGSYAVRGIRNDSFLYLRNFFPERWPAGDPEAVRSVGAYGDVDNSITKMLILASDRSAPREGTPDYYGLAFGKRPATELYDLRVDPHQIHNVAEAPAYAGIRETLDKKLSDWMRETGDPRHAEPRTPRWDTVRFTPSYGKNTYDRDEYIGGYRYARSRNHTQFDLLPCTE